jgi:hypothetical protein
MGARLFSSFTLKEKSEENKERSRGKTQEKPEHSGHEAFQEFTEKLTCKIANPRTWDKPKKVHLLEHARTVVRSTSINTTATGNLRHCTMSCRSSTGSMHKEVKR